MNLDNIERVGELIRKNLTVKEELAFMKLIVKGESLPSDTDFKKAVYMLKNSFKDEQVEEFLNKILEMKEEQLNDIEEELRLM